jgi:enediyne biosynthesis protein E4
VLVVVVLLTVGIAIGLVRSKEEPPVEPGAVESQHGRLNAELLAQLAQLEAQERHLNETTWADEMLAQACGRTFEIFWDELNASTNRLEVAASFPVGKIVLGQRSGPRGLRHGIELWESDGRGVELAGEAWRGYVEAFRSAGWELGATEFRHRRFDVDEAGRPEESRFYFAAHLDNVPRSERAVLEGELVVSWDAPGPEDELVSVGAIDASGLSLKTRRGELPFREMELDRIAPPENAYSIDPLIAYDLDGDGLSEIILAGKNLVYRRNEDGTYRKEQLCRHLPGVLYTAVLADFDGDGAVDLLCASIEGLWLVKGSEGGTFEEPGRLVRSRTRDWKYPFVLTCGDIDGDGDLDVFVGQYKVPYEGGAMPTPYYDANDGDPAYLLLNDGKGDFTDVTESAGLGAKRHRRCYSASFVDLDGDGAMDLVVVSDFAGVDLYRNDGRGRFTDVTRERVAESEAFGMAHSLADFNGDGRLDLLMIGMPSPAVDRLEHMGLWRTYPGEDRAMRARMVYGNRLFLARATSDAGYEQNALSDSIARSGWSWGCGTFDFDNDAYPDVYVANGLESRDSVSDYEPEYWLHDLFVGTSESDSAAYFYFKSKFGRTRGRGQSYGGFERNRLYWNQEARSFLDVAHLFGTGNQEDSRNVVADDLDGDGRVDLIVTSFEPWPESKQILRIYRNELGETGRWIGFRFRERAAGPSPVGASVKVRYGARAAIRHVVTGDSHRSQHGGTVHFGLGDVERVDSVEIRWPGGAVVRLRTPELDRYHTVETPGLGGSR